MERKIMKVNVLAANGAVEIVHAELCSFVSIQHEVYAVVITNENKFMLANINRLEKGTYDRGTIGYVPMDGQPIGNNIGAGGGTDQGSSHQEGGAHSSEGSGDESVSRPGGSGKKGTSRAKGKG